MTKTKALCVATRCTTIDQFVSTFHRFCGDDQSFFVATLTSRPVGLETAFSIQLADKQPVMRGLCVVLDAWATPANEFKRPGIRLGIKRLTPDSQIVYDRLRAASSVTAIEPSRAELAAAAAPLAGPPPVPPKPAATPPAIMRMQVALRVGTAPPDVDVAAFQPAAPRRASEPKLPGVPDAPGPPSDAQAASAVPPGASVFSTAATPPSPGDAMPAAGDASPSPSPGAAGPSTSSSDVGADTAISPSLSATSTAEETPAEPSIGATTATAGDTSAALDADADDADGRPLTYAERLRTPGSDLVLPANPLHDLTDESLEGFVDCTLYEETGAAFIGELGFEDPDDPLAEPPVVPAMPFDEMPNLMLESEGLSESLRIEPLSPQAFTQIARTRDSVPPSPLASGLVSAAQQWVASGAVTGTHPSYGEPAPPTTALALGSAHGMERDVPTQADTSGVVTYAPAALRDLPPPRLPTPSLPVTTMSARARWLLIGGCTVAAFAIAFTFAVLARDGKDEAGQVAMPIPSPRPAPAPVAAVAKPIDPAIITDEEPEPSGAPIVGGGPCKLAIATTPAGSVIKLDDQAVGVSPMTIASTCDKHKVDIAHARYQGATKWVTLAGDKPQSLEVSLARPIHAVTVTSVPAGAEVSIDGHRAGTTPTVVQLMGYVTVSLTFTKPGFAPVTKKLYSKTPKDHLFVKLTK